MKRGLRAMKKDNRTKKVVELAKQKTEEKKKHVLNVIEEMAQANEKITFYSVYKKAGVSKSFVYNNDEVRGVIEMYRDGKGKKEEQTKDSKDVIIEALQTENEELKKKIRSLKQDELWKEKYENKKMEVEFLKRRLEQAYGEQY